MFHIEYVGIFMIYIHAKYVYVFTRVLTVVMKTTCIWIQERLFQKIRGISPTNDCNNLGRFSVFVFVTKEAHLQILSS